MSENAKPPATPDSASPSATASVAPKPKQENALANLLWNVLLPVTILSYCSKKTGFLALGPKWALVVAVLFPIGYQIYDWQQRRKINAFSIIGLVSVLLTGGLGLLELGPHGFAAKEASIPFVLALVILWGHKSGKSLTKTLFLNPDMVDIKRIDKAVAANRAEQPFAKLLWQSTLMLAGSMFVSSALNYALCLYFLHDKIPGSEEYTKAIGKQTGWGFVVIGVPMMLVLVFAFIRFTKGLSKITGLKQDELMLPR